MPENISALYKISFLAILTFKYNFKYLRRVFNSPFKISTSIFNRIKKSQCDEESGIEFSSTVQMLINLR